MRIQSFARHRPNVVPLLGRFSDVAELLSSHGVRRGDVDGFLFDTGASSVQYDVARRGFSIKRDGPLDMRMDKNRYDVIHAGSAYSMLCEKTNVLTVSAHRAIIDPRRLVVQVMLV